jgi:hypothetical protein
MTNIRHNEPENKKSCPPCVLCMYLFIYSFIHLFKFLNIESYGSCGRNVDILKARNDLRKYEHSNLEKIVLYTQSFIRDLECKYKVCRPTHLYCQIQWKLKHVDNMSRGKSYEIVTIKWQRHLTRSKAIWWLQFISNKSRAIVQEVGRRPLTAEASVRARISPCGNCGGKTGTRAGFSPSSSVSPVSIIPPWLSMFVYHLGNEQ